MRFGWYGFQVDHPEEWGPSSLSGTRETGYVRLTDSSGNGLQVRWATYKNQPFPRERVEAYLAKLKRDKKKHLTAWKEQVVATDDRVSYIYQGPGYGVGEIRIAPRSKRVFFVEACSPTGDRHAKKFRPVIESFQADPDELESWAILGLSVRTPPGLVVRQKGFHAGRTKLMFDGPKVKLLAERWGFAEQLVERHGLEKWAREALSMKTADCVIHENRAALRLPKALFHPATEALIEVQPATNEIQLVRVTTNREEWKPTWDWFTN